MYNQGYTSRKGWEHLIESKASKVLGCMSLTYKEQGLFCYLVCFAFVFLSVRNN